MYIRIRKSYRTLDRSSPVVLYVEHYTSRIEFLNFVLPIYQISKVIWVVPNGHWIRHTGEIRRLNPSKQTKRLRSPAHSYRCFGYPWYYVYIYIYISIFFEAIWFCLPKHRRFPSPLTLNVDFFRLLHVFWATQIIFHLTWHMPYLTFTIVRKPWYDTLFILDIKHYASCHTA